jgi:pyrroline-5-carboxylate reductase
MESIGFIGGGKMAEAMIAGLLRQGALKGGDILVGDVSEERRALLASKYGAQAFRDNRAVAERSRILVLAVKPQSLEAAAATMAERIAAGHLVVSILAGKRIEKLQAAFPKARIVRVMPNLGALVGEGMSAFCCGGDLPEADRSAVRKLLSAFGQCVELPEARFDAVTALSGSGPAFFAHFLQCMCAAASALGIPKEEALTLATQTMLGTACLIRDQVYTPESLIKAVSSEKGTTVAGMAVLLESGLPDLAARTLQAAASRSAELSR